MSDTKTETKPQEPQAHSEAKEPTYSFPDTTNGPAIHFDQATHTFWLGVRIPGSHWEDIKLFIDSGKFHAHQVWKQYADAARQQARFAEITQKLANMTPAERERAMQANPELRKFVFNKA